MQTSRRKLSPSMHPRRMLLLGLLLTQSFLAAGCSNSESQTLLPPYDPSTYRLGVDDHVHIVVYGEAQLTGDFRVTVNGNVVMPLIGSLKAANLTTDELGAHIAEALTEKKFLRNPSVTVDVASFRLIAVLGEVVKPGQVPYQPGMTMLTAVAAAGGFTYRGVQDHAYVIRQDGNTTVTGTLSPQSFVKPGDVIKIAERYF